MWYIPTRVYLRVVYMPGMLGVPQGGVYAGMLGVPWWYTRVCRERCIHGGIPGYVGREEATLVGIPGYVGREEATLVVYPGM